MILSRIWLFSPNMNLILIVFSSNEISKTSNACISKLVLWHLCTSTTVFNYWSSCLFICFLSYKGHSICLICSMTSDDRTAFSTFFKKFWNSNFLCYARIQHQICAHMSASNPRIVPMVLEITACIGKVKGWEKALSNFNLVFKGGYDVQK